MGTLKDGYRGLIKTTKADNDVIKSNMQGSCGLRKSRLTKKEMYKLRYEINFLGMSFKEASINYGLTDAYIREKVFNYGTMSLVIPRMDVRPEDYEG